jgi:hypothetical protein
MTPLAALLQKAISHQKSQLSVCNEAVGLSWTFYRGRWEAIGNIKHTWTINVQEDGKFKILPDIFFTDLASAKAACEVAEKALTRR